MIVYGKRIIEYIIKNHPEIVEEIFVTKKVKLPKNFKVTLIDNKTAQRLSKNSNHQGFLAKINFTPINWEIVGERIVVLDNITDMGNIGAIVRSAYSFGIDLLIITGIKKLKWDRVIRTSSGAALDMKIIVYKNMLELINILKTKGYFLIGADFNGKCKPSKKEKIALFLGSEGEGLQKRVKSKMNEIITIKMKNFDSLNVSVAAGILMDRISNECI